MTELDAATGTLIRVLTGPGYRFNEPVAVASDGRHMWVANANLHLPHHQLGQQHLPQVRAEIEADMRGVPAHGGRGLGGTGDQPVPTVTIAPVPPAFAFRSRPSTSSPTGSSSRTYQLP